jgi:ParB family chromosome partitioning protein
MAKMEVLKNLAGRSGTQDSRSVSLTIKDIPLGDIKICDNVRKSYSGIEELSTSIRQYGLLQPITVYPEGDYFVVKTGHRRFMAFQKLYVVEPERFHSIRCILSTSENLATIQLVENVQREELSQIDLYNALSNLRENGMTLKQIAEVMGKTEKVIKNLFVGINEIDGDNSLKEFIDSPAGGTINDVAETKCVKNKDDRLKLLEKRKRGEISRAGLRKEIKALKYEEPAIQDKQEAKSDEPISPEPFVKYDVSPNGLVITLEFCDKKHAEVIDTEIRQLLMSHQVKVLGV